MVANPISYESMIAYSQLHNVKLSQWDIDVICQLDSIALTDPVKLKESKNGS